MFTGVSPQPYATPVEKKTLNAVAAVAHAEAAPGFHSPGLSLGASAGNLNLRGNNKGSSTMVVPVRQRLRTKTPPAGAQRVPSMGVVRLRRRMRSKGPPPQPRSQPQVQPVQEEHQDQDIQEAEIRLGIMVYQALKVVRKKKQVLCFK